MGIVPGSVDEYIASYPDAVQAVLQRARAAVRRAAPDAEETISYGMPTYRLYPGHAVSIGAWKHHIGMYPVPEVDGALAAEVGPYVAGKGTLRFPLDQPFPEDLVERLVAAQLARRPS